MKQSLIVSGLFLLLVMAITITALILKTGDFYRQQNWLLVGLSSLLLGA